MGSLRDDMIKKAREESALKMLADGKLPIKDIVKYTGLTVREVRALMKKETK